MISSFDGKLLKNGNTRDTSLHLDCFGNRRSETAGFENSRTDGVPCIYANAPDDGCKLVLGLGPAPSTYSDNFSTLRGNKSNGLTSMFEQGLSTDHDSILKLGLSGVTDEVSRALDLSASTECTSQVSSDGNKLVIPVADEGSTSGKKSSGYLSNFYLAPRLENSEIALTGNKFLELGAASHCQFSQQSSEPSGSSKYSISIMTEPGRATVSSDHRTNNTKRCKFAGCTKGARGATGLCIGHGGGHRCRKPGCNNGAESKTVYCKAHGGGRRCQYLGCTKSAEGKTDYCIAHGGGKRCGNPGGCTKAARGKSGLCIRHGGGKRCKMVGCTRSAEGQIGLCISHGGGRRCQFLDCTKGAQGSTLFCKAHGGGKRCTFTGCTKGAEGSTSLCKGHGGGKRCLFNGGGICPKSVHGGTNFCVAHGGGKRCAVQGCTKSARGKTDCCVRHGGGKRCKFENCDKSAQGSTDFCKAHGGGKRCNWSEGKCEKFSRGKSGLCAAHSSLIRGQETIKGGMLGQGLFHGLVPVASNAISSFDNTCLSSGVSVISDSIDSIEKRSAKRQQFIPPQVLVPQSMKASSSGSRPVGSEKQEDVSTRFNIGSNSLTFVGPEGRVHGSAFNFVGPERRVHGGAFMFLPKKGD
ncbi:unnamed protein product [Fraxinus pennsylvanica]|uniref:WRKY19-like zinc finger domain-containing protein n=1 Tax=Fraxinus pennsylvanica TaxID=56036 RepID=A0AAD1ZGA6_9LAMI|nr:unnamed protein product [Fraxinus pennsylvanica]